MSLFDDRDAVRDSPERAFSLLTVRAAISSARLSERPAFFSLSLTASYWRARLVPFFTPLGGVMPWDYPGPCGEKRLGQFALEDFACGVSRQRVEELDLARNLVAREILLH